MPANRYLLLTLAVACLVSWFYFGDVWCAPNNYLFTSSGDGLQGYYQTSWHVRYDSDNWRQHSLNYPFGESIFFTGGQPLLSNTARMLGLSDSMIGVSNVFMLCSGIIATLFVFLLLMRLGVSGLYSSVMSLGIVMLSQQWERLCGHFALSVMWAIPLLLWLFIRYFESIRRKTAVNWILTFSISAVLFVLGMIQLYYMFFAAVLMAAFTLVYLFRSGIVRRGEFLVQAGSMFLLPFLSLQWLMHASSEIVDRTSIPWGFLIYRSSIWSYIYPIGMPYEKLFVSIKPNALEWEGLAFVGLSTLLALFIVLVLKVRKRIVKISSESIPVMIQALIVASVFCVLVSMAFPFNIGFESLLYQLGAIQQFRGIGRFAFVAYYPITVVAFSLLYRQMGKARWMHGLSVALCLLLLVEGHARMNDMRARIVNPRGNTLTVSNRFNQIDASKYQAIHPLPYVHVGSENIGFSVRDEAMRLLYDASFALGLPSTATIMSRTSLSESFLSCAMDWELMEEPSIVSRFPDGRPLLVLADRDHLKDQHRKLLVHADSLFSDGPFTWYELPLTAFADTKRDNLELLKLIGDACVYGANDEFCDDSTKHFMFRDTTHTIRFTRGWSRLFQQGCLAEWKGDTLAVSFWVSDFKRDLVPRTVVEFIQYDAAQKVVDYHTEFMGRQVVGMRGSDALVEYILNVHPQCEAISMAIENKLIQGADLQINSFLMRPTSMNCRILRHENQSLNNRNYSR
jgi:hypothetical protein